MPDSSAFAEIHGHGPRVVRPDLRAFELPTAARQLDVLTQFERSPLPRRRSARWCTSTLLSGLAASGPHRRRCRHECHFVRPGRSQDGPEDAHSQVLEVQQFIRSIERSPPPWYQAVEVTLVGICVACFCFGETNPGKARFLESEPWFAYRSVLDLSLEDVINLIFCAELFIRAWANEFRTAWFLKGNSVIDLVSCMPVLDRAFSLTPSPLLTLELTILRSFRFVRIVRLLKATAKVANANGKEQVSIGLSVVRVVVSAVGTLFISSGLLWRVEGRNGLNPSITTFADSCFYMLNVFTSQGAPFPVLSTEGRFVTSVAIVIGLLSLPLQVSELLRVLGGTRSEDGAEKDLGDELAPKVADLPEADSLEGGFSDDTVASFCHDAGVDTGSLQPDVLEAELADVFTLLEDPVTAGYIAADPLVRIKLAAALVRRKRRYGSAE